MSHATLPASVLYSTARTEDTSAYVFSILSILLSAGLFIFVAHPKCSSDSFWDGRPPKKLKYGHGLNTQPKATLSFSLSHSLMHSPKLLLTFGYF